MFSIAIFLTIASVVCFHLAIFGLLGMTVQMSKLLFLLGIGTMGASLTDQHLEGLASSR